MPVRRPQRLSLDISVQGKVQSAEGGRPDPPHTQTGNGDDTPAFLL